MLRVFFVTSGRLAIYEWEGGRLGDPLSFGTNEDGLAQFSAYLANYGSDPVYMLVDVVEEEFREETMPHVIGADRKALIRTKLNRLFRDPTYAHAIFLQRERDGRRDDRMLFTALIRPDLLAPWVGQISKHKVPLAGIYSVSALSAGLLKPLGVADGRVLLVTLQSSGALRQTFFSGGMLKLSRLAIMPNVDPRGYASYVLGEVEKLRRYLNSLRMLPHDSPLDVHILCAAELLEDIQRQSPDSLTTRHHVRVIDEFVKTIGVKGRYNSPFADRMFAHMLARKPPANQYAPPSQTRYYTLHQAKRWLKVASIVLLAGSFLLGGIKAVDGVIASRETETVRRQTTFYEDRYRVARERLPATPVESHDMKQAVDLVGRLAGFRGTPVDMMVALSRGLGSFPGLQLDAIVWRSSADPQAKAVHRSRRRAGPLAGLFGSEQRGEGAKELFQVARVTGRIEPFDGNYRGALEIVGRFADSLRGIDRVRDVQIVSLPLDIGSEASLSGDVSVEAVSASAPFELRVVIEEGLDETG